MKKFLSLVLFSTIGFSVFSQTLSLSYGSHNTSINYGDTILVEDSANVVEMLAFVKVLNNAADTSLVFCKKRYISIVPGTSNLFCWAGTCYSEDVFASTGGVKIAAGETSTDFSAHYEPYGHGGVSLIKYIFNVFHGDSAYFYIKYSGLVGIEENNLTNSISKVFPVPANDFINIDYTIPLGSKSMIEIYSICGKIEKQIPIANTKGTININVSDLASGIYLCSVKIDGRIESTRRLIITH